MSIKSDSKFTGNSIILKLSNSYVISSILLKVTDIKRHKLVKTLKIYYSNRIFQSAIDLKNAKDVCYVAKEFTLQTGQHEAKIQFILPITASNLIIEYSGNCFQHLMYLRLSLRYIHDHLPFVFFWLDNWCQIVKPRLLS